MRLNNSYEEQRKEVRSSHKQWRVKGWRMEVRSSHKR